MISITANYNCDPIARSLGFWAAKLGWADEVRCAPYNQVFQQLVDPTGLLLSHANKASVLLVRHEDWARFAPNSKRAADNVPLLRERTRELIAAIEQAATKSAAPFIVVSGPASDAASSDPVAADLFRSLDQEIAQAFAGRTQITFLLGAELARRYQCSSIHDPHSDHAGHVPYTQEFFAVLGTAAARTLFALRSPPRKVIVLDCDNTLWTGVLGEDGVNGVTIEPGRRALQELMVSQQQRGALLCLCSKNNEPDVWELFDQRSDMILSREHIVASRINWLPKSANIAELAAELDLGLDSFVFVDDDSLQCAEVRANCPQVMTIQVPAAVDEIAGYFDHLWILDRPHVTAEDRQRTQMYKVERAREDARKTAGSVGEFLASLELETEIRAPLPDELPRLSQLTQRTNQFNLTTVRRSEAEIRDLANDPSNVCLSVRVSDRFGDYGLVGLAIARVAGDRLDVDSLLMSCRVLGRGVEHRIVARLGQIAQERGLNSVVVRYRPTAKNAPARDFVAATFGSGKGISSDEETVFVLDAALAASTQLRPDHVPVAAPKEEKKESKASASSAVGWELVSQIAERRTSAQLLDWMTVSFTGGDDLAAGVEVTVAKIIAAQLGLDRVTRDDDFYELGGDSLKALQALAQIRDLLGVDLSIDVLMEPTLTVATLTRWVEQAKA